MTLQIFEKLAIQAAQTYYGYNIYDGEQKELTVCLDYDSYMNLFKDMYSKLIFIPTEPTGKDGILIKQIRFKNLIVYIVMNDGEVGDMWSKGKPGPNQKFFEIPITALGKPVDKQTPVIDMKSKWRQQVERSIQMQTLPHRA